MDAKEVDKAWKETSHTSHKLYKIYNKNRMWWFADHASQWKWNKSNVSILLDILLLCAYF